MTIRPFKKIALVFISLFSVLILLVLKFGYVDVERISKTDEKPIPHHIKNLVKIGEIFDYKENIEVSPPPLERLEKFTKFLGKDLLRFNSSAQISASFGSYPTRLEGMDGVFIDGGKSLIFTSPFSANAIAEFYTGNLSQSGKVTIDHKEKSLDFDAPPILEQKPHSTYHESVGKFLDVSDENIPRLAYYKTQINIQTGEKVEFKCDSKTVCFIGGINFYQEVGTPEDTRNVIFILVDTLRHDALTQKTAPFLSSLTDFKKHKNTYAAGNMTSPSTNSLLSCQKPSTINEIAFSYSVNNSRRQSYYKKQINSFPSVLKNNGFKTAMIGNISVVSEVFGVGVNHGFDYNLASEEEGYETARAVTYAKNYLSNNINKNNFLYLHLNAPHAAYRPPLSYLAATYNGVSDLSSGSNVLRWLYRGEVNYVDSQISRLFNHLKKIGIYESATIIITSDHGDQFEQRNFVNNTSGPAYTGSYFDHGATLFSDEVKVPFMIKSQSSVDSFLNKNIRSNLNTGHQLLSLLNLNNQSNCESFNEDEVFGVEGMRSRSIIFKGRYKYIRSFKPITKKLWMNGDFTRKDATYYAGEMLFDLQSDPEEKINLLRKNPDLYKEAKKAYVNYYKQETGFEISIESPKKSTVLISIPGRPSVEEAAGLAIKKNTNSITLTGELEGTRRIKLKSWHSPARPTITLAGNPIKLSLTNLRLKHELDLSKLPHEFGFLIPSRVTEKYTANIRKVYTNEMTAKRISTGNPEFEKVLRQWGYLNDD